MALTTTTLAAACGANDTTIRVTSAAGFRPQQVIRIDDEILGQNGAGASGTTISVRRGVEGTIPIAHINGATVMTGTAADFAEPLGQPAPAPPGTLLIRQQVTTIPHAQILTLPTAGVPVLAAPGANRIPVIVSALCLLDTAAGAAYTSVTDASWSVRTLAGQYMTAVRPVSFALAGARRRWYLPLLAPAFETGQFAPFTRQMDVLTVLYDSYASDANGGVNEPLTLDDSFGGIGNYAGGHVANTLTVTLCYIVYDSLLRRFV